MTFPEQVAMRHADLERLVHSVTAQVAFGMDIISHVSELAVYLLEILILLQARSASSRRRLGRS